MYFSRFSKRSVGPKTIPCSLSHSTTSDFFHSRWPTITELFLPQASSQWFRAAKRVIDEHLATRARTQPFLSSSPNSPIHFSTSSSPSLLSHVSFLISSCKTNTDGNRGKHFVARTTASMTRRTRSEDIVRATWDTFLYATLYKAQCPLPAFFLPVLQGQNKYSNQHFLPGYIVGHCWGVPKAEALNNYFLETR